MSLRAGSPGLCWLIPKETSSASYVLVPIDHSLPTRERVECRRPDVALKPPSSSRNLEPPTVGVLMRQGRDLDLQRALLIRARSAGTQ